MLVGVSLAGVFLLLALGQAAVKPLWFDELITVATGSLPSLGAIWHFYATGLDTTSPLPSLIVHGALRLPASPEISARLPFILAFLIMLVCMYRFVRRRYGVSPALAAMVLSLYPPLFSLSIEARGYAFVVAGAAFAMVCWQSVLNGRHRFAGSLGIWFGLAVAINAHAFAIFLFVPFALAQLACDLRTRRPTWPVWAALLLFPLGILPVLHGERLASHFYGGAFWSRPQPGLLIDSYKEYFDGEWFQAAVVLLFVLGVAVLAARRTAPAAEPASIRRPGFSPPEWVLVVALACLPFYALPASYLLGVYRPLYVTPFSIGMEILLAAAAAEQARAWRVPGALLFTLLAVPTGLHMIKPALRGMEVIARPHSAHQQLQRDYDAQPWVSLLENSTLPVVASDHIVYAQLFFYAPPALQRRLWFLTDAAQIAQYPLSNTEQHNFLLFGSRLGYNTEDVSAFLTTHPHFLLAMGANKYVWLPQFLLSQAASSNATLQLLGPEYGALVSDYDVRFDKLPVLAGTH